MEITIPGKVFFFGGYSVLLKNHISLSIAVLDKNKKGLTSSFELGERRIISKQFSLDIEPSLDNEELVSYAYVLGELYLKSKGFWKDNVKIELENSPIFGDAEEKSGLGSSAAATVAIIKSLFKANDVDPYSHLETIHKLSQMAYAFYSQKIGSGFDIATSSFGKTIVYERYDPESIVLPPNEQKEEIIKAINLTVEKPWGWIRVEPISIDLSLVVFNVKGAKTSTISAVKAWKQWKMSDEEKFNSLMNEQDEAERNAISSLKNRDLNSLRKYTHKAREVHRKMQDEISKVVKDFDPVEPKPLTNIIDKAEQLEGVVVGRCPGAGGWDSLAFLVENSFTSIDKIVEIGKEEGLELQPLELEVL